MLTKPTRWIAILSIMLCGLLSLGADGDGCDESKATQPHSDSGVAKAHVEVPTQASGLTTEQENVQQRLVEDNKPGAIKHLYVISAMSGQVILYSTVKGKVTSSGKRLSPATVAINGGQYMRDLYGYSVGAKRETAEVLQDDGTYGSSVEYVYWWDTKGAYHQHYVVGGQILHVSSQPLAVKNIIINVETGSVDKPTEIPVEVKAGSK
jgi:hypothetical protein